MKLLSVNVSYPMEVAHARKTVSTGIDKFESRRHLPRQTILGAFIAAPSCDCSTATG
jgi:hypothetical protein